MVGQFQTTCFEDTVRLKRWGGTPGPMLALFGFDGLPLPLNG